MHIEIGILSQPKLLMAGAAATAVVIASAAPLIKAPTKILPVAVKTLLAAFFFSILMQLWHMPIGPSELHLVGAMPIYLLFGFVPTILGFGIGLFLQAFIFEPQDMVHLSVNFLSLAVPLIATHNILGKRIKQINVANVIKLDAVYYTGVTLMVGFWLSISSDPAPLADWAAFAASYILLVAIEPIITVALVMLGRKIQSSKDNALNKTIHFILDENWINRIKAV